MTIESGVGTPLTLTTSPRLDEGLRAGWDDWLAAARAVGAEAAATWLAHRAGDTALAEAARSVVEAVLDAVDGDGQADAAVEARVELAEVGEAVDDQVAETFWEGVIGAARDASDPDALFEATGKLAATSEAQGDPMASADAWIAYLGWRREPGHLSDPEQVETAFDEVVRLAERAGASAAAAQFGFRRARYAGLVEAEDDRAWEGDWEERGTGSYEGLG